MVKGKTALGLEENVEGALCYLLGFFTGIFFYLVEGKNKFIRFHAVQSIIVFIGLFIIGIAAGVILPLVSMLVWVIEIILWFVLMFKAYKGEKYMLPVVGEMAEKYSK